MLNWTALLNNDLYASENVNGKLVEYYIFNYEVYEQCLLVEKINKYPNNTRNVFSKDEGIIEANKLLDKLQAEEEYLTSIKF